MRCCTCFGHCDPARRIFAIVLLCGSVLTGSAALVSCSMPRLTHVADSQFPTPASCAECHVEIYREWEASPHALAFVNERFRRATDDYGFEACLGCHAPESRMVRDTPAPRAANRELGVTCVSCHLDNGAMVGPIAPTGFARPHPIRVDPAPFEQGRLCGHCHAGTLAQWQSASVSEKQDCRACHMPEVRRKMTQATGLISKPIVAAEEEAAQHQHTFLLVPTELKDDAIELSMTRDTGADTATITLMNRLPHHLPTGDFGVRVVTVSATGLTARDEEVALGKWEITSCGDSALSSGQTRSWSIALSRERDLRRVRINLAREGRDGANRRELFHREIALP